MAHQRQIIFEYGDRGDVQSNYVGGYKVLIDKRLSSITSNVKGVLVHKHVLAHGEDSLTRRSCLDSLTLVDASGASVRPLKFNWVGGQPATFDHLNTTQKLNTETKTAMVIPVDFNGSGRSDILIASQRFSSHQYKLHLAVYQTDKNGDLSVDPLLSPGAELPYPMQLLPLDMNGNGRTDLVSVPLNSLTHS